MFKKTLLRIEFLHNKDSWKYEELNELEGLYREFYIHVIEHSPLQNNINYNLVDTDRLTGQK